MRDKALIPRYTDQSAYRPLLFVCASLPVGLHRIGYDALRVRMMNFAYLISTGTGHPLSTFSFFANVRR
ncbi:MULTISPECIES: hypothetical protein [unclassified Caballeronia]|uniref:hypothetical protein n=1 Tax=unclassified Caballeronia TaxID=2646786 RepID=UPI0020298FA9|nr:MULTISPECIES: hypothetical protein [unclassified Caballeronia]